MPSAALPSPDKRPAQTCHGADCPGRRSVSGLKLCPGIDPDLADLFLHLLAVGCRIGNAVPDTEPAAGDFEITQPVSLFIRCDLEHPRPELRRIRLFQGIAVQPFQEFIHALQFQRGPEITGDNLPGSHAPCQLFRRNAALFQIGVHPGLFQKRRLLIKAVAAVPGKVHAAAAEPGLELFQDCRPVCPCQVHLVDEKEHRHVVAFQQFPQRLRVRLHPVRAADDQDGVVQHLHGALGLCGKVHVSRRIQQSIRCAAVVNARLVRKNGNAPVPFHGVGVQECSLVIDPSQLADLSGAV